MAEVFSVNCKNCGASAHFDPKTQRVSCDYCGSNYEMSEYKESQDIAEAKADSEANKEIYENKIDVDVKILKKSTVSDNKEAEEMSVYSCEKCGAEVLVSSISGTAKCPFCDNNLVFTEKFAGDLRPDLIIPFEKSKEDAIVAYEKFLKTKKRFLANVFTKNSHIEDIQGIYVPYWLYDAEFDVKYLFEATKLDCWSDSKYDYTKTSYYDVVREGTISYKNVPRDASLRMDDNFMDSIEPFDMSKAVDFSTYYIAGYLAERYDVSSEECTDAAMKRMNYTSMQEVLKTLEGYSGSNKKREEIKLTNGQIKYAMYPVWFLSTRYKDKSYSFAMNGQNGNVAGDRLPADPGKVVFVGAIISVIFSMILCVILGCFMSFVGIVLGLILGIIAGGVVTYMAVRGTMETACKKKDAKKYIDNKLSITVKKDKYLRSHTRSKRKE